MAQQQTTVRSLIPQMGFDARDEALHTPNDDPYWQESFWVYWGDGKQDGGCIHVGQEVNAGTGNVWASCYAQGIAYRRVAEHLPLDRELWSRGGHAAGGYRFEPHGGKTRITARDVDFEADLVLEDIFPYPTLLPIFPGVDDPARRVSGTHYQTPGRITGKVRLGDRELRVDALAQRGHSWGARNHKVLLGHGSRWMTGAFGPDLSFSAYTAIRGDGSIVRSGFVIEGGAVQFTSMIDVIVEKDIDSVSHRGGSVAMTLPDGKRHLFQCVFDNVNLFQHHGVEITVAGGRMTNGPSGDGWCAWEVKDRPPTPPGSVPFTLGSLVVDGLHRQPG